MESLLPIIPLFFLVVLVVSVAATGSLVISLGLSLALATLILIRQLLRNPQPLPVDDFPPK